jgi:endoglycosylceramidase
VQADYVAMWTRLAAREKDRPGVIGFEPMNEPSAGSADNGDFESTTLTRFHQAMATLFNQLAPGLLVFVDPAGLTSTTRTTRLGAITASNVVYAPHYYQPPTIFGGTGNAGTIQGDLQSLIAPSVAWKVPAFIGEWGVGESASDAVDYASAHDDAFDALGMSATQWEYSVAFERWNSEALDVLPETSTDPVTYGGAHRPHVRALAGTRASVAGLTVRFTPSAVATGDAAVTEIAVPSELMVASVSGACVDEGTANTVRVRPSGSGDVEVVMDRRRPQPL